MLISRTEHGLGQAWRNRGCEKKGGCLGVTWESRAWPMGNVCYRTHPIRRLPNGEPQAGTGDGGGKPGVSKDWNSMASLVAVVPPLCFLP